MERYMFDTNAYNDLLDSSIGLARLPKAEYYCTFEQYDELQATSREPRRKELIALFTKMDPVEIPVETFILGNARLDKTKLGDGKIYSQILEFLDRRKKKNNNLQDALIAEVAAANGLILVTGDEGLFAACGKLGIPVRHLSEIILEV